MKTLRISLSLITFVAFCITSCCQKSMRISKNANKLIKSYQQLVLNQNTKSCSDYDKGAIRCISSTMPSEGFNANDGVKGKQTTFVSLNWTTNSIDFKHAKSFHTIWATKYNFNQLFSECKTCIPSEVEFPYSGNNKENHSFYAVFVPIEAYKNIDSVANTCHATDFSNSSDSIVGCLLDSAVDIKNIKEIKNISLEKEGEYMSIHHRDAFNNSISSVGIYCNLLIKEGESEKNIKCYIFNNYDQKTDLIWKIK